MSQTQKSTSTKSAHNESDAIGIQDVYYLSDYAFQIQRNSVASSTYDQITAVCTNKDGKNARQAIQLPSSTQLDGWYVDANDTTADVYAKIKKEAIEIEYLPGYTEEDLPILFIPGSFTVYNQIHTRQRIVSGGEFGCVFNNFLYIYSSSPGTYHITEIDLTTGKVVSDEDSRFSGPHYTNKNNTPFYYKAPTSGFTPDLSGFPTNHPSVNNLNAPATYWYDGVDPGHEIQTVLVGRFAIDLEDAGGDGPGSDWTDPGDWNEDWEEGDPTQTLHVEVIGALSGRHNDPIEDPSYSYIPADKETVKGYGCGGDGGHGGGGGAGASTVVVYKFATNQADSKEVTAIARRHGYGSGGGKGGKGGDGCILVYY